MGAALTGMMGPQGHQGESLSVWPNPGPSLSAPTRAGKPGDTEFQKHAGQLSIHPDGKEPS